MTNKVCSTSCSTAQTDRRLTWSSACRLEILSDLNRCQHHITVTCDIKVPWERFESSRLTQLVQLFQNKYTPTLLVFKQYLFMLNFILEKMALYTVYKKCFCCSWNFCAFDKYCMLFTSSVIEYVNTARASLPGAESVRLHVSTFNSAPDCGYSRR